MKKVKPNFKKPKARYFFKEWRKHRGLTQEDLAERVGVSTSSISQLERGLQGFTDSTLEAIAEALSCKPGDLLMRNPLDHDAPWSILDTLQKAPEATRQQIVDYANYLMKTGTDR
ncbi:helix-turn-helix transcriptional regulator [Neorhizobium sp. NCHU2750]|uniref:helix-turn-helix domain-containing protein n=1 Tax=Neorhizobium sp. NCHU2750 TaxID=1825976 RepID=UPI000E763D98|nr:hypothetical protein NCHU2750_06040 [Neorhizobium sp. NCHU2750]